MLSVPVVDQNQQPLMPTTPNRAASWIKSDKATPFWKHGVFCVRLNVEPSARVTQAVVVGVDPGSKKEGFTVKSRHKTFLNIQADARTGVEEKMEVRRNMRRTRRSRKTPYRKCRLNRAAPEGRIPPSTKARWQWKLRVLNWLCKMYPIKHVVVEDVKAETKKGKYRWNKSFSPLQVGKQWLYAEVEKFAALTLVEGERTAELRSLHGLTKINAKLSNDFHAHCVDSWVMANSIVGGHFKPDFIGVLLATPFDYARRQLHLLQPTKGGFRRRQGGTRSLGFNRGSLVEHPKHGLTFVGGSSKGRVSLHDLVSGKRISQHARPEDLRFLSYLSFRTTFTLHKEIKT